ncbi:MAG: twin-arginine translocation signal domain-containing protein [Myxococcota bacterium]|nr:twin-arginine translocation signal domain-containing protein [Myxococcota bacterium]
MNRRDFVKMTAFAGASVIAPLSLTSRADSSGPYEGPLYFFFNAIGGWDTTLLCDPKGTPELNRSYTAAGIRTAGNIAYAPAGANQLFFEKYGRELLVLNGMDMSSPNHAVGQRYISVQI